MRRTTATGDEGPGPADGQLAGAGRARRQRGARHRGPGRADDRPPCAERGPIEIGRPTADRHERDDDSRRERCLDLGVQLALAAQDFGEIRFLSRRLGIPEPELPPSYVSSAQLQRLP